MRFVQKAEILPRGTLRSTIEHWIVLLFLQSNRLFQNGRQNEKKNVQVFRKKKAKS